MTEQKQSKRQLFVITGARGVGKSGLAYSYARPSQRAGVIIHDTEGSANRFLQEAGRLDHLVDKYIYAGEQYKGLPSDEDILAQISVGKLPWKSTKDRNALASYYEWFLAEINQAIVPGVHHTLIVDTLERLEAGIAAWTEAHKRSFGLMTKKDEAFGRLWSNAIYVQYQGILDAIWARGIDTVIFCSHLKNVWENNRPVLNKVSMSGKKILYKLAMLMIWLVNEPSNVVGEPAGLVIKERMGKWGIDTENDEWTQRRMLPRRIPICTWPVIRRYLEEGCNLRNPAPGESLSTEERDMISPLLDNRQMQLMLLEAETDLQRQRNATARTAVAPRAPFDASRKPAETGTGTATEIQGDPIQAEVITKIRGLRLDTEDTEIRRMLQEQKHGGYHIAQIVRAFQTIGKGE